jgi:tetratricopeptide (TPR) repeat protein
METDRHSKIVAVAFMMACLLVPGAATYAHQADHPSQNTPLTPPPVVPESPTTSTSQGGSLSLEDRADLFMARKDYHEALDYYQRALKQEKGHEAAIWNKIGIAHQNLQNLSEARKAYKNAIRIKKDFSDVYNNIGTTYYLSEKPKTALKWYRQAIDHNPANPAFHYNLGTALYATKKYPEAIESYQHVLDLDPNFFTARSSGGTTLQAKPAEASYFFYIAKVFARKGRAEESVRYLRRALEEGFKNFDQIDQDPDLKTLAEYPPYIDLRANPPKPL